MVPITLTSCRRRLLDARGVDLEVRVQHGVDLRGAHHALEDRVRRVGLHELGAARAAGVGSSLVDADHELDVGSLLERAARCGCPRTFRAR